MIVNDQTHPTPTLDMLAQLESKMDAIQPFETLSLDGKEDEGIEVPPTFAYTVDEEGRKMYRIPWGAELAALSKSLRAMRRRDKAYKMRLAPGHYAMVDSHKKRRRKLASVSRRRNYA